MMEMPQTACFILAHGFGSRLYGRTGAPSKGLLRLDENTTILCNLLRACRSEGLKPVVTVRPDDAVMAAYSTPHDRQCFNPNGYIMDLTQISQGLDDIIVVECDIVAHPKRLQDALRSLLQASGDCALTLAANPLTTDPRAIRPIIINERLRRLSEDPRCPRTTGLYRFRGHTLEDMRRFVTEHRGTFHDFMVASALCARAMTAHTLDLAFNINAPSDLNQARRWWNSQVHMTDAGFEDVEV